MQALSTRGGTYDYASGYGSTYNNVHVLLAMSSECAFAGRMRSNVLFSELQDGVHAVLFEEPRGRCH